MSCFTKSCLFIIWGGHFSHNFTFKLYLLQFLNCLLLIQFFLILFFTYNTVLVLPYLPRVYSCFNWTLPFRFIPIYFWGFFARVLNFVESLKCGFVWCSDWDLVMLFGRTITELTYLFGIVIVLQNANFSHIDAITVIIWSLHYEVVSCFLFHYEVIIFPLYKYLLGENLRLWFIQLYTKCLTLVIVHCRFLPKSIIIMMAAKWWFS